MYTISIINGTDGIINKNSLETGCGGSETWALQLANAFVKHGHTVVIFSKTEDPDITLTANKVNIIQLSDLNAVYDQVKFDFTIVSRILNKDIFDVLIKHPMSKGFVFYQFHDLGIFEDNFIETSTFVDKLVTLTPYHTKFQMELSKLQNHYKHVNIPNGIDLELFEGLKEPKERSNRLLWCSNPDRGLYLILKYLYQPIKKEIPDFGIDVAYPSYASLRLEEKELEGMDIKFLGSLSKKDLYKEMMKHKCWCYPQNWIDTFCISMLECAMANVNIVCPWWYAPGNIFGDLQADEEKYPMIVDNKAEHSGFFLDKLPVSDEEFVKYLNWLGNLIIYNIKNYNDPYFVNKRKLMRDRVIDKYSWNSVANMYESLYQNEKLQHGIYE